MRYSAMILCLLPMVTLAVIYKSVDKRGNVSFSDQPVGKNVQRVDLPPTTTYNQPYNKQTLDNSSEQSVQQTQEQQIQYTQLNITNPANNSTIWYGVTEKLTVRVTIQPSLQTDDQAVLLYDGQAQKPIKGPMSNLNFTIQSYKPGKHSLKVEIRRNNNVVKSSSLVAFYVLIRNKKVNN
jgi:hypothetical protein